MNVRITSDGTVVGTRVLNDAGESIGVVQSITWTMDIDGPSKATIVLAKIPLEAVVEADIKEVPVDAAP